MLKYEFQFDKSIFIFFTDLQYCSMLENSKTVKSRNRRVVNGLAVINSWDWLVRLEFFSENSNIGSLCGGTVGRVVP